jgi:hypothetical protein
LVKGIKMSTPFDFANFGNMFGGMQGGTPTGLDALLSEDQRKLMGRNATLAAAAALLQASGRSTTPIGLGQALGSALQAGQQGYQQARAGSVQDLLLNQKLQEAKTAQDLQKQIAGVLTTAPQPMNMAQAALAVPGMPLGPTKQRAELMDSMPQPTAAEAKANQYLAIADIYAAQGKSEEAKRFQEMAERFNPRPEAVGQPFEGRDGKFYIMTKTGGVIAAPVAPAIKPEETVGQPFQGQDGKFYIQTKTGGVIAAPVAPAAKPSGTPQQVMGADNKPALVQYYDDGSYKTISGVSPLIPRVSIDRGGSTQFMDPYSIPSGTSFAKTLGPQVVGNPEDGYFLVGGGGGGMPRLPAAAPTVAGAARPATAPAAGTEPAPSAAPATAGPVPLIPGTGKAFAREESLRKDYTTQMKPFIDLGQAFRKVEAAALNPSAAGDISLVYGYMKILDPGSTVMQGEQATATNAGSVPDRVRAQYNKALTGQGLIDEIRQDFYAQSRNLIESQRQLQQDIAERYRGIAVQNRLDPNQIIFDPFQRIQTPAQIAAAAAKTPAQIAADAEKEKKKPKSFFDTYNLLKRN